MESLIGQKFGRLTIVGEPYRKLSTSPSKQTELRAKHIWLLYKSKSKDKSRSNMAFLYGVSEGTIKMIVSNKTWN